MHPLLLYIKCETNLKDINDKHVIILHNNNNDNNNTGIIDQ